MAQLIVALDYTNAEDALATAESLRGCPIWMKVGLELFTHEGPAVVKKLKDMGFKVMLDLKMFDIPNTVAGGQAWGLDGVVCSGHEVEAIKSRCPGLMCLTPGIRPASGSASDDQRRIMTPAQAVRIGSDFLVVGRPITKAPVPADAARAILDEMEKA